MPYKNSIKSTLVLQKQKTEKIKSSLSPNFDPFTSSH